MSGPADRPRKICLLLQAGVTWAMTGIIWMVQVVVYPLFGDIGEASFVAYHERYMWLVSWIVGPLIILELITVVWSLLLFTDPMDRRMLFLGAGLFLALCVATFFGPVQIHQELKAGYSAEAADRLVTSNWIRTILWTCRALLLLRLCQRA